MTNPTTSKTLEQTIAAIEALDLRPIKFKATRKEDGYGWTPEYADKVEIAYKRYLILVAKYPLMTMAPSQDIDRFWHSHILDTQKYAADCEATFGHFLHHFPYLGLRGGDDAKVQEKASETMRELYGREFGEAMPSGGAAWCAVAKPAEAAWCAASRPVEAAWCAVSKPTVASAWCAVAKPAEAAWCAVAQPIASVSVSKETTA